MGHLRNYHANRRSVPPLLPAGKPYVQGDFGDHFIAGCQQDLGLVDAKAVQVGDGGDAHFLAKAACQVPFTQPNEISHIAARDWLGIMGVDVNDGLQR